MAISDYRLCDKCGRKAFCDRELNYDVGSEHSWVSDDDAVKLAGTLNEIERYKLDHVGDWAVLCRDCAKEFKTQIVPHAR